MKQAGFTIIELVVVIVLLGIMAATALPRFMDVSDDAHASVVDGVRGGMQSGISMYHAQWVANGQPDADVQIAEYGNLRTNASGYPYGTDDNSGGSSNVTDSNDCSAVYTNVLQGGAPSITDVANVAAVVGTSEDFAALASGTNCVFYYTAETSTSGSTVPTLTYNSTTGILTEATAALP